MKAGQLVFSAFIPGSFWVKIQGHVIIPDGVRFLVIGVWSDDGYWLAWRDGIAPPGWGSLLRGTLLKEEQFRRE